MKTFEFIILVVVVIFSGSAFASSFTTTTGQGYFTWNNQVISEYSFLPNTTFNLVEGVMATDTSGIPDVVVNKQAFIAYSCTQSPGNPGC